MRFQIHHRDDLGRLAVPVPMAVSLTIALAIFMPIMRIRRLFDQAA